MSFLARLAMRAGIPGDGAAEPLLVPKDRGLQRSPRLFRQEAPPEEEDEEVQTLRRQLETEGDEEEVQTLRRQVAGANEGAASLAVVAPTSAEVGPDAPRTGDELRAVRRMAGDPEEEEAQPVRRMMQGQEEAKAQPPRRSTVVRRSVRGASAHGPPGFGAPAAAIVADQPEPSRLRAPGETAPMPSPASPPVPVPIADRPDRSSRGADAPLATLPPQPLAEAAELSRGHFERPQVVIDRLDVLIHEPTPAARGPDGAGRRSRSFRARYLARL
jgi:hypothetical protein